MASYRHDFFDFDGFSYFNCAYQGPMPRVAVVATEAALQLKKTPHLVTDDLYFSLPDAYRDAVANLIGCSAQNVAVADSTTHGVMLVVNGLDWRAGDEVVTPRGEFPANHFPWRSLERRGVNLKEVELVPGRSVAEQLEAAITPRTRVVSMSWVRYSDGRRLNIAEVGELCRSRGVLFVVDGSQGIGGLRFDLSATPCDVLACSGYKWLLGPYGLGFAYVAPELGERLALGNINWFSIKGAEDFNKLSECELDLVPGARRFDINETANFINLAAGTAALRYLRGITPAAIVRHVRGLLDRLVDGLPRGFRVTGDLSADARSNLLCVSAESDEATESAFQRLAERRVVVSRREGTLRFSPHLYNGEDEIDRALDALAGSLSAATSERVLPVGEPVPSDSPALSPERRSLVGRGVSLSPLDAARDVADLYRGSHGDPEKERLWTYLFDGPHPSEQAMRMRLAEVSRSEDPLFFTVVDNASSERVGMAAFQRIRPEMRCLEIAHIWYTPAHQGTTTNTETVYLMLREAFERLGYRRVEWKCDALNRRSRAAALRLGFRFEGIFRQHMIARGRNRDTAWYSMLDLEWQDRKQKMERWLSSNGAISLAALNGAEPAERFRKALEV